MTTKSITGDDLLKYISNRKEILTLTMTQEVKKEMPKNREKVRRMFMGRIRELTELEKLIYGNKIQSRSKTYAKEIFKLTHDTSIITER